MAVVVPEPTAPLTDREGRPTPEWYVILSEWAKAFNAAQTGGETNTTSISDLEDAVAALPASAAEVEAHASTSKFVSPGLQHRHPGSAKATLKCGVAGDIQSSYGVTSVTDDGAGRASVSWTTAFSSADYTAVGSAFFSSSRIVTVTAQSANAVSLLSQDAGTPTTGDPTHYYVTAFGDQ